MNFPIMKALPFAKELERFLTILLHCPRPSKISSEIKEVELSDGIYYIRIVKQAFKKKEDAELFDELDKLTDSLGDDIGTILKSQSK